MSTKMLMATMIGICGLAANAFGATICPAGSVGVENPGDGPDVCFDWGEAGDPLEGTDFEDGWLVQIDRL